MDGSTLMLGFLLLGALLSMVLFVLFGQITVKKLRNNPLTKNELGVELVSGWDIINVAQSLSLPMSLINKFRKTRLSFLYSNVDLLIIHTNKFDRILAALFYWVLTVTGLSTILWACLDTLGLLN
jgi:hypothetical protein